MTKPNEISPLPQPPPPTVRTRTPLEDQTAVRISAVARPNIAGEDTNPIHIVARERITPTPAAALTTPAAVPTPPAIPTATPTTPAAAPTTPAAVPTPAAKASYQVVGRNGSSNIALLKEKQEKLDSLVDEVKRLVPTLGMTGLTANNFLIRITPGRGVKIEVSILYGASRDALTRLVFNETAPTHTELQKKLDELGKLHREIFGETVSIAPYQLSHETLSNSSNTFTQIYRPLLTKFINDHQAIPAVAAITETDVDAKIEALDTWLKEMSASLRPLIQNRETAKTAAVSLADRERLEKELKQLKKIQQELFEITFQPGKPHRLVLICNIVFGNGALEQAEIVKKAMEYILCARDEELAGKRSWNPLKPDEFLRKKGEGSLPLDHIERDSHTAAGLLLSPENYLTWCHNHLFPMTDTPGEQWIAQNIMQAFRPDQLGSPIIKGRLQTITEIHADITTAIRHSTTEAQAAHNAYLTAHPPIPAAPVAPNPAAPPAPAVAPARSFWSWRPGRSTRRILRATPPPAPPAPPAPAAPAPAPAPAAPAPAPAPAAAAPTS